MKNILLTGSGGFIGIHVKEFLSGKFNLYTPRSFQLNLLDKNAVTDYVKANEINFIIHSASCGVRISPDATIEEIAKRFNCDLQDVVLAIESKRQMISLNENIDDDNNSCQIGDKVPSEESLYENVDFIMLKDALNSLNYRDKKLIILRYFRNKTQTEVAESLGVSQVQVSRLENKILENLRRQIE